MKDAKGKIVESVTRDSFHLLRTRYAYSKHNVS